MILKVAGLTFNYPKSPDILKDIHLQTKKGDFVGIIGPNGSGKSTFIKTIGGFLSLEKERVYYKDKDLTNINKKEFAKFVASVPQLANSDFNFTVEEIVTMGRTPHLGRFQQESKKDIEIVNKALSLTNTLIFKNRHINELSGGERQRVVIARALAQEPEVLLLDEPTAFLDINYQKEVLNLIKMLNKEKGLTVLVVLHDLNLASQYCNSLIMLKNGKVFAAGSAKEVITKNNIEKVYNTKVWVDKHPISGNPVVSLYLLEENNSLQVKKNIHIIGGGGSATVIMHKLASLGYTLTAGVLNKEDSDLETALALNIAEIIEENPFSPISNNSYNKNIETIRKADAVIVSDVPIGHGNLKNFLAAREALKQSIPTFILMGSKFNKKDYTNGEGFEILKEIYQLGGIKVRSLSQLIESLTIYI